MSKKEKNNEKKLSNKYLYFKTRCKNVRSNIESKGCFPFFKEGYIFCVSVKRIHQRLLCGNGEATFLFKTFKLCLPSPTF